MTGSRSAVVTASVSVLLGLAGAMVSVVIAESALASVAQIAVVGVAALALGVVVGLPIVACLGVVGLGAAHLVALGSVDSLFDHRVVIVAPLLWASLETAMRSFELRPPLSVSRPAQVDWLAMVVALGVGTVAVALVTSVAVGAAPDGGLTFRVAAVVVVVLAVVGLAVVNLSGRAAGRARG